jgi:flavin-binding protein dodecin
LQDGAWLNEDLWGYAKKKGGYPLGSNVVKVIELVGESDRSWEDAVQLAVKEAAKTLRGITGVEVMNWTGQVNPEGDITGYRADIQVAFRLDS